MIRKIIIVVLTLIAVASGTLWPISCLSRPMRWPWTAPAKQIEAGSQELTVQDEYALSINPRDERFRVAHYSVAYTWNTPTWKKPERKSLRFLGFRYGYVARKALYFRVMGHVDIPFWFLTVVSSAYPLLVFICGPLRGYRRSTRLIFAALLATLGAVLVLDLVSTFRFYGILRIPLVLAMIAMPLYGMLRLISFLSSANVAVSRDLRRFPAGGSRSRAEHQRWTPKPIER